MYWQNIQKQLALTNSNLNDPIKEKNVKKLGEFQASVIAQILVFMLSSAIIITYVLAIALKQDYPIPHCMITATATNYPGYIFFRVGMLGAAPFFFLIYVQLYWYIIYLYKKCNIPKKHAFTPFIYILTCIVMLFYVITIATIDTGKSNGKLHSICAILFFVLANVNFLLIYYHMHVVRKYSGTKYISNENFYTKVFLGITYFVIFGVGLYILKKKLMESGEITSIVEWSITTLLVLQVWTCCWDFKFFKMSVCINKGSMSCNFEEMENCSQNNMNQPLNNNYAATIQQQAYVMPNVKVININ